MPSPSERPGPMRQIASNVAATTKYEVDCSYGRDLLVVHHVTGSTGGYVSGKAASAKRMDVHETARGDTHAITSAARSGTAVTVTIVSTTGMLAGDKVIMKNIVGDIEYNGTYDIASVPGGGVTFTYTHADSGTDTSGLHGTVQHISQVAHHGGTNIKSSNTTTGYSCVFADVPEFMELTLSVGGGTHNVWVQVLAG